MLFRPDGLAKLAGADATGGKFQKLGLRGASGVCRIIVKPYQNLSFEPLPDAYDACLSIGRTRVTLEM